MKKSVLSIGFLLLWSAVLPAAHNSRWQMFLESGYSIYTSTFKGMLLGGGLQFSLNKKNSWAVEAGITHFSGESSFNSFETDDHITHCWQTSVNSTWGASAALIRRFRLSTRFYLWIGLGCRLDMWSHTTYSQIWNSSDKNNPLVFNQENIAFNRLQAYVAVGVEWWFPGNFGLCFGFSGDFDPTGDEDHGIANWELKAGGIVRFGTCGYK